MPNQIGERIVTQELVHGGVLIVRFNRPERANAWSEAMERSYYEAIDRSVSDSDVRAVVITGAGRTFCPGMDMQRLREIAEEGGSYELQRRPQTLLRSVPKPVIAAVNGACAGVGFVQALMADIRYTAHDAKWTAPFAKLGLVAEDAIAWRLQRVAGEETAADLLLSGRVIDGDEAVSMRIASRAYPRDQVLQEALSYARHFATRSPTAMAYIKRQLLLDAESGAESARQRALQYLAEARSCGDYADGVRAYRDARPPHFDGLLDGQYLELPKREDA
ncbi:MAG: hypothetical protein QOF66_2672 [Mycobacterium sp.]|jgi:enoyl-CoA hydratase/carnithine racemase|uniref:enoyl-CoA hydratase-related protein n=1 Tax=Mycobacterium sp. TaxID=1785 RepID=UPI0028B422FF|nr:hypothetical protein [Mycobacterium sp.]